MEGGRVCVALLFVVSWRGFQMSEEVSERVAG